MGKSQIPGDWRQCCTCEYWAGNRDVYYSREVLVETSNPGGVGEKGRCLKDGCGWKGTLTQHSMNCPKWEKWRALR